MSGNRTSRLQHMAFGPITVAFDEQVLRPRPWTLMQSEWAAELARSVPSGPVLELCAGAGHIGLAAAVLSDRDLVQVELEPAAGRLAVRNAAVAGRAARTEVRIGSMQHVLGTRERFPLIVSDPPYLPTAEVAQWPDDPVRAIDGGADGLTLLRLSLRVCAQHLMPGGAVLLQVAGPGQARQIGAELPAGLVMADLRVVDERRAVVQLCAPA